MIRLLRVLAGVLCLWAVGAAASGESIDGVWKTEPRKSGAYITVRIAPCTTAPEQRCGTIAGAYAGARPDMVGDSILRGLQPQGDGHWAKGEIIRPGKGSVYSSELTVAGDELEVKGCAVGGLFCGSQIWTRVH